jgi:hypothetical protein
MTEPLDPNSPPTTDPPTDPDPDGIVEVQGQKMVPLAALTAERQRVRQTTGDKIRAEFEPLKAKAAHADQLAADLERVRPQLEYLARHPPPEPEEPKAPAVSDEEAERVARDYELYTPTGLDLTRAKRIISKQRAEVAELAGQAAEAAMKPLRETNAIQAARQNFVWAASQVDAHGHPLVDPGELAQVWASFPAEMIANPQVAQEVLKNVLGAALMSGKRAPLSAGPEPVFSEQAGGRRPAAYQMSEPERLIARSAGIDEKKWAESAKTFKPDSVNILGD